jgi:hypothetical protein
MVRPIVYQKQTVTFLNKKIMSHWGLFPGRCLFYVYVIMSKADASFHSALCLVAN